MHERREPLPLVGNYIEVVNGQPVAKTSLNLNLQRLDDTLAAALSVEYDQRIDPITKEPFPDEIPFEGMSNLEVLGLRVARNAARGEIEYVKFVYDRLRGKPRQSIDSTVQIEGTFKHWLQKEIASESTESIDAIVIEAGPRSWKHDAPQAIPIEKQIITIRQESGRSILDKL